MKRIEIFTFFLVISFLVSSGIQVVLGNEQTNLNVIDRYNLYINEQISTVDQEYIRSVLLTRSREIVLLNFTVQNHGEPISSVTLQAKINGQFKTRTFYLMEKISLSESESYQFSLAQQLYLPLGSVTENSLKLSITLILDPTINWRTSNINFQIINAELITMDYYNPLELSSLDIFPASQYFIVEPEKYTFLEKSLAIHSYLFVVPPPTDFSLLCTLRITLTQLEIDSVTVNQQRYYGIGDHTLIINYSLSSSEINPINEVLILIKPDYNGFDSAKAVRIELKLSGVFQKDSHSNFLPINHPIPGWIMLPVLIFILFVFPYYYAYQEMVVQQEKEILNPVNQDNNY